MGNVRARNMLMNHQQQTAQHPIALRRVVHELEIKCIVDPMTAVWANTLAEFDADICSARFAHETQRVKKLRELVELAAAERREAVLALRERGWTLARIGEIVGITPQGVKEILMRGTKNAR